MNNNDFHPDLEEPLWYFDETCRWTEKDVARLWALFCSSASTRPPPLSFISTTKPHSWLKDLWMKADKEDSIDNDDDEQ